ncbi:nucleoside-diphosphate-sugar epimerase [Nitrosomonas sp. PY1]|uniref:NAD-dependent epimerase/dehydratase family protein n=1 Tax=Nitrosomonas sp. PY1 TaxID=1803906 RepID=UPI001FC7E9F3|nr:NAD(P)-dependent oxidoreductase [Nitrosomonas sp. PY1]GKS69940.1 nucleoside-diphosphate-sugar epimerase [Nitrosomonas sp. PY1]
MLKLVAVTGATGFIGKNLTEKLIADGYKVRALGRKYQPSNESIQWIQGDLGNSVALNYLVRDVSAVIHCAATVRGGSFKEFSDINIQGTRNLLEAIVQQPQSIRFLYISSLAARQPELSWYAQSKYLSEQALYQYSDRLNWTVFRPTAVYGPGDKELKPLFQSMRRGLLPVVSGIHNRFGLLHVKDLVAAMLCWLSSEKPVRGIFELDDGTPTGYDYQSLSDLVQREWRRPVRCISIPDPLIRGIAFLNLALSKLLRYSPMLTPGKVNELQHTNWVCDNTSIQHALPEWRPRIRLQDSLSEVI